MKKKLIFIALFSILSLFIVFSNKIEANEYSAYNLVSEYYNEFYGEYTKKTQIHLSEEVKKEYQEHFHVNAYNALDRTTYYSPGYLFMGDLNGKVEEINSGFYEDEATNKLKHFKYVDGKFKVDYTVNKPTLKEYFVVLDDMINEEEGFFEGFDAVSETKYTYNVKKVVGGIDTKLHEFLWFAAPGLNDSFFTSEVAGNYFTHEGITLVVEELSHVFYGEYLSFKIILDPTDIGKVKSEEEISDYNGEELVLCEARVYKGLKYFDENEYDPVFAAKFTNDYIYRVGNKNEVNLGVLFTAVSPVRENDNINVTIEPYNDSNASGVYTAANNSLNWANGTISFSGKGVVKVTINGCELLLEVIDAMNATGAMNATSNDVVLLKDAGFSSLEVSGGYTLYGNGFTLTCGSDSVAADLGYSFVTLNNGTLDNVQIVCPDFDYAALYKSNLTSSSNRSHTDSAGKTRYYNARSGVMVSGNSQILNSRISGGRAAVNVTSGNLLIDNSQIEGGAVANILVGAANSLTLRDITLIQKPTASTYDSSKTLMGFSVLYLCDGNGKAASTTLEGTLIQKAWVGTKEKQYVPSEGQNIVDAVMKETSYIHQINGEDKVNLGFAYLPEEAQKSIESPTNIADNRINKDAVPYEIKDVKIQISILSTTVYVYSYKNTNGTNDAFKTDSSYEPNTNSDIITVDYFDNADGLTVGKSYGEDGWTYELNVDLDKLSGYSLDFSKLAMNVNGVIVNDYKVNGEVKPSTVAVTAGGTSYTLTATIDGKTYTTYFKVTGTETSKESPSLVASNYEAGLCVASSYGGTWHGAAPALEGIQIKYWSVADGEYKTINLADYTPSTKGQLNGTNTTWTYSPENGDFTLTLTGGQVHSSNNVFAMPVVVEGKLYFVAAKSNGLVNSGNSARTIPVTYSFKDNNNGDELKFSHTWSVAENKDAQYKYSDFCSGTLTKLESSSGGSTGCVTPDTLITLADGSQVRVDSLTGNEELLVWNLETGKLDSAPIMFVDSEEVQVNEVVYLHFSDGTKVGVIYEHGFWDYDLNRYVYLDNEASQYVGHWFAKQNGEQLEKVQLVDVEIVSKVTSAWSPVTVGHLCYFVNGMLSMPGGVGGLFNIFEVDSNSMTYDFEAMERDILTYGLYTYEELNEIVPLSREMFEAAGGAYLKISIAKGNMTIEDLIYMINRYSIYL